MASACGRTKGEKEKGLLRARSSREESGGLRPPLAGFGFRTPALGSARLCDAFAVLISGVILQSAQQVFIDLGFDRAAVKG
jgi:hypothetical protein